MYNIWLYVERRQSATDKWETVGPASALCLSETAETILPDNEFNPCDILANYDMVTYGELSEGVRSLWKNSPATDFRVCDLGRMAEKCADIFVDEAKQFRGLSKSLGMKVSSEDGELFLEFSEKNPLTFPVNKELVDDYNEARKLAMRAYRMIMMIDLLRDWYGSAGEWRFVMVGA